VPTKHHIVGGNHPIFNNAIMRDVTSSHEIAIATDRSDPQVLLCSAIDRHALSKNIAVADDDLRWGPLIRKILRLPTNHATWEELVVPANGGMPSQCDAIL
jgi:hypothetical protein